MELDFTRHIKPLQDAGVTAEASIAAALSAFTVNPIPVEKVVEHFRRTGLWFFDVTVNGYAGKLQAAVTRSGQDAAVKAALQQFASLIFARNSTQDVQTTNPVFAPQFKQVLGALVAQNDLLQSEVDAFYALGGGLLFSVSVSEADVVAEIAANAAADTLRTQKQTLEDAAQNRMQTFREALTAWDGTGAPPEL